MLAELVLKNRSYRRFHQHPKISEEELRKMIDLARITSSARNNQTLKYILVNQEAVLNKIFPHLSWAGYLTNWDGPAENERPVAYIIVLRDDNISTHQHCDDGIAMQTILLAAVEMGLGGCILGAFNKSKLTESLSIPNQYQALYVIALGKPSETVLLEKMNENDVKYYRDSEGIHHVPKRDLNEIIIHYKIDG